MILRAQWQKKIINMFFLNSKLIKIYSKIDKGRLLHAIVRASEPSDRLDISPENEFLQVAKLTMNKGKTFAPHKHIYKNGEKTVIAQESWVVIRGEVKVFLYDLDNKIVHTDVLYAGDASITFYGGHNYEILKNNTLVYEYKTGPYKGQKMDKECIL